MAFLILAPWPTTTPELIVTSGPNCNEKISPAVQLHVLQKKEVFFIKKLIFFIFLNVTDSPLRLDALAHLDECKRFQCSLSIRLVIHNSLICNVLKFLYSHKALTPPT